jgi:hypothetical protein
MASVLIAITGIYCLEIDPSSTVTAHTNNSPAFLSTIPLTYLPEDGLGTNLTPPGTNMSLECLNCKFQHCGSDSSGRVLVTWPQAVVDPHHPTI